MVREAARGAKAGQWALGVAAWVWVAALFLAPAALRPFCGAICHQRVERSFFVGGAQLPVCARCTGIYLGAAVAVPVGLFLASPFSARRARGVLFLAALPTAVTWTLEVSGVGQFSNAARFSAALPLGAAAAWLVLSILADD